MATLVTGGAGYIGSIMTEVLLRQSFRVIVADNLSRGHRAAVPPEVPFFLGDLTDQRFVSEIFETERIDAVLHFAACSLVGESMQEPGLYFRNNVVGVLNLLEVMVRHHTPHFILSSTAATYGDPDEVPIPESAAPAPTNPYGESKLLCERLLHWFGRTHGLRWTALRYFNAAGASKAHGEHHEPETHLIPLALAAAQGRGDILRVFGLDYPTPDGTCVRDYVHVEDLAEAHLLALQHLERGGGGVYNLGNGMGFSVLEVIQKIEEVTGRKVPWEGADRRPGDPPRLVASSAKAQQELGWIPRRQKLETIVGSAWQWMNAHPRGYLLDHD